MVVELKHCLSGQGTGTSIWVSSVAIVRPQAVGAQMSVDRKTQGQQFPQREGVDRTPLEICSGGDARVIRPFSNGKAGWLSEKLKPTHK